MTDRTDYITGLRALADLFEAHDDLPLPSQGQYEVIPFSIVFGGDDAARERMARAVREIGGNWQKHITEAPEYDLAHLRLRQQVHGLHLELVADRNAVCTRVVTGTRQVTEEVPDPDAPMVTVTKQVDDIEWVCEPLLADRGLDEPDVDRRPFDMSGSTPGAER